MTTNRRWWQRLAGIGCMIGLLLVFVPLVADDLATRLAAAAEEPASAAETVEPPTRLMIPSIKIDAVVDPVRIDARGEMASTSPYHAGWLELTARPGAAGAAVIAGHLDWGPRPAIFWRLRELRPGDSVFVVDGAGETHQFVVRELAVYPWQSAPLSQVYGSGTAPTLRLVTCAGWFNPFTQNYDQRLVVYTDLVPGQAGGGA